ncbi:apolipoprotein N-acyltransferase [Roseovarius sp. 2305UL8-3]|uniref:apolipoprotein N-acyltransferase n=1 Tax=Roseovarius conchicola TaxID=3121636 RepID=UPI003526FAB5
MTGVSPPVRIIENIAAARARTLGLAAVGIGGIAALGQAPLGWWPLSLLAFAAAFGLLQASTGERRAAWLGWAFGTGYFIVALHWIVEPFLVDAPRYGWMAPFALLFLGGGLALFWLAGFALARWAGRSGVGFVASLTLVEAARGVVFTGFPWAQPGHIWIGTGMMQWAAFAGALGLCVITFTLAIGVWQLATRRWLSGGGLVAAGVAGFFAGGALAPLAPIPEDAPTIRLIQPNAAQHEKWDPEMIPVFFQRQIDYSAALPRPDLVVWPETAIPALLNNAKPTLESIAQAAGGVPVVLGAQRLEGLRLYNSLVLTDPQGQIEALYDKHHLVPFGEYLPFGNYLKRFGLRGLAAEDGNGYTAGPGAEIIDVAALGKALPLICYEGVFPYDVASAPERADFMLLITNDAWFGQLSGPYQHFAQARLRSVEQGLPMIRVANTGISAMIDGQGHVRAALPLGEAGYLDARLPPPLPPTLYARTGDGPILILLLLGLGGAIATARRRA